MRAAQLRSLCVLLTILCTGCAHKTAGTPQQAQAPPLQTGKGTLEPPKTTQQAEKTDTPLASPLPPPSAQSVPLPPPPPPKKVRKPKKPKPADTPPVTAAAAGSQNSQANSGPATAQATSPPALQTASTGNSPIGQLTIGDSASGEKTKHETADLIGATQQGLIAIKRPLSNEEKATAGQIHNYLKQAQQALDNGDADGAHLLATRAKVLLDELTKP
jgi:hypothetical protein